MESTTPQPANFLSLPPELRNRIYSYTFSCDLSIFWNPDQRFWYRGHDCRCTGLALMRVCRQIRIDTIPIFFGTHTMRFDAYNRAFLEDWLNATSSEAIASIQRFELVGYMQGLRGWVSSMKVDLRGSEATVECFVEHRKPSWNTEEVKEALTCNVNRAVQDLGKDEAGRIVLSKEHLGEVFDCVSFDQES